MAHKPLSMTRRVNDAAHQLYYHVWFASLSAGEKLQARFDAEQILQAAFPELFADPPTMPQFPAAKRRRRSAAERFEASLTGPEPRR